MVSHLGLVVGNSSQTDRGRERVLKPPQALASFSWQTDQPKRLQRSFPDRAGRDDESEMPILTLGQWRRQDGVLSPQLIAKTGPTIQQLGLQENHTSYTVALVACNQSIHPP